MFQGKLQHEKLTMDQDKEIVMLNGVTVYDPPAIRGSRTRFTNRKFCGEVMKNINVTEIYKSILVLKELWVNVVG